MNRIVNLMMHCISCVIKKEPLDSSLFDLITNEELESLLELSKKHDVAHIVSFAIAENGIKLPDEDLAKKLKKRHPIAVLRYEALNKEYCRICEIFEKEKLQFIPLKGAVIREYYPHPWMRTSCDIDILVHEEDLKKVTELLVNAFGYDKKMTGTHDVSFFSQSGIHVEIHYKLAEIYYDNEAGKLMEDVWKYAFPKDGYEYHCCLKDEFYYLYHIYHMAKHFEVGGCGVRTVLDLWILDNIVPHDDKTREVLLVESGLLHFANECRKLSRVWFSNGEEDELVQKMQNFILLGGVYGSISNRRTVKQAKTDSRIKYVLYRIFMPYEKLKIQFPIIKKHKWLTPFCQFIRWFKIFLPKHFKTAKREFATTSKPKNGESQIMAEFLMQIGLK